MSHNGGSVIGLRPRIDLDSINDADARRLMSAEHKALGYRPPPGSLAAEAQAAASKHPNAKSGLDPVALERAALDDAERIRRERVENEGGEVVVVGGDVKLTAEERKAIGVYPGPGSLTEQAERAAAVHPQASTNIPLNSNQLESEIGIDLNLIGKDEARKIMSEEHKALGYRPPPGSLAAEAQAAASKHPDVQANIDPASLTKAALEDAKRIESKKPTSGGSSGSASKAPSVTLVNVETTTTTTNSEIIQVGSEEHADAEGSIPVGSESFTEEVLAALEDGEGEPVLEEQESEGKSDLSAEIEQELERLAVSRED